MFYGMIKVYMHGFTEQSTVQTSVHPDEIGKILQRLPRHDGRRLAA